MACGSCGILSFGRKRKYRSKRLHKSRRKSRKGRKSGRKGRKRSCKGRKRSRRGRRFGIVAGPGYKAQTSYPNAYAPYFGSFEPFVNASQWWYPYTNGVAQSPQMLYRNA